MTHEILLGLTAVVVLGIVAQWLAWRLRVPSILVLLLFGLAAGPFTGFLDPDHLMGDLLLPLVSLSVALILFEGGMTLRVKDLRHIGRGLTSLVTVGALVTWVLTALAAGTVLGFSTPLAVLLGAILVVTGPTVVLPLLRHVRPREPVGSLVKWEGILNDPVGAVLAVLVFEAMSTGGLQAGSSLAAVGLLKVLAIGVGLGALGAGIMVVLLRFYHLPEYLESPFTLMMVVLVYTVSDTFQAESGLLTVTLMGIAMANQRWVSVQHILQFKENIRVLLISSLFIFLAARLELHSLSLLGAESFVFLAVLILIIRPVAVFVSMLGSGLSTNEKLFVSWMAPRGIVAAAVSSVFALRLEEAGYAEAEILVPLVFLVIMGTVVFYGLTASPVARRLGLSGGPPQGCLVVGAHSWGRAIAEALHEAGIPVLVVDNNRSLIAGVRMAGLPAHRGNILDEDMPDRLPLEGIGKLIALTSNHEVNSLAALHFADVFGRQEVYQLSAKDEAEVKTQEYSLSQHLRGRLLFEEDLNHAALEGRFAAGGTVKTTSLTEEFDLAAFRARYGDEALVLFVIDKGMLKVSVAGEKLEPKAGQTVIAVVEPVKDPDVSGEDHKSDAAS